MAQNTTTAKAPKAAPAGTFNMRPERKSPGRVRPAAGTRRVQNQGIQHHQLQKVDAL